MSIEKLLEHARRFPLEERLNSVGPQDVERVLNKSAIRIDDLPVLLSEAALDYLEPMAQKAADLTRRHFGNVIFLFTPLYIANYCENRCPYCSFAQSHRIQRKQLTLDEVSEEAHRIAEQGIRHILVLTGEARNRTTFDYLRDSVRIIAKEFSSIGIEVYPMSGLEYGQLIDEGVDSLTVYQETYDPATYEALHKGGPKQDYLFRLKAPDRACRQNIRAVQIGSLLGLYDFRRELASLAYHAQYLQDTYPDVELSLSFPRIRPLAGDYQPASLVSERHLVQIIAAFRILFPHLGITVSTRESETFRNGVLPLGPTRMSAGVSTAVGGHSEDPSTTQFEISDTRSVFQMRHDLKRLGFQVVMHDWNQQLCTREEALPVS